MSRFTVIAIVVAAILVALAVLLIVRRRRYVSDLRGRGWTFESSPVLESVLDHSAPPFGLGFTRAVDESISGTTSTGVAFHVFEYTCRGGGPPFDARLASLRLPLALPPIFVSQHLVRSGVNLASVQIDPAVEVRTDREDAARAFLSPSVKSAINDFGQATRGLDLSIDGDHLVSVGAPKNPEELASYLESLARVVTALDVDGLASFAVPPPLPRFGFFGRPDWVFVDRDDSLIAKYDLTTVGSHHRTERAIRGDNDGLPIEAFIHRWQTQRREAYIDSQGKPKTRTVTEQHEETVTAVWLPFPLPQLSINGGRGGQRVKFELEEFNQRFAVRTSQPKFAYDVIHPRTMEYLMRTDPPDLAIEGQVIRFTPARHDTLLIGQCADFAHEFLGRVPAFVWRDLGVDAAAFRRALR